MSFETKRLVGSRVLVTEGDNSAVLDSTQWDEVKTNQLYSQAVEDFDQAVEDFFKPLLEAADKVKVPEQPDDPASYVVLNEAVDSVDGHPAHLVRLNRDSVILRLIEQGDTDRLLWVAGNLEVIEYSPKPVALEYSDVPDSV